MKINNLLLTGLLGCISAEGYAQSTVNYTAGPGQRNVTFNGATAVPNGNQVRIGYFDPGFNVGANASDLPGLLGAWHQFGATAITTIFGQAGRFADTTSTADAQFSGQKVSLWVFKTSDNSAPAAGFANVTAYGLFSSSALNWLFSAADAAPPGNTTSVNSSEVNQAFYGSYDSSHLMLSGIGLNAVPEPSAFYLLALGLGGLGLCSGRKQFLKRVR